MATRRVVERADTRSQLSRGALIRTIDRPVAAALHDDFVWWALRRHSATHCTAAAGLAFGVQRGHRLRRSTTRRSDPLPISNASPRVATRSPSFEPSADRPDAHASRRGLPASMAPIARRSRRSYRCLTLLRLWSIRLCGARGSLLSAFSAANSAYQRFVLDPASGVATLLPSRHPSGLATGRPPRRRRTTPPERSGSASARSAQLMLCIAANVQPPPWRRRRPAGRAPPGAELWPLPGFAVASARSRRRAAWPGRRC